MIALGAGGTAVSPFAGETEVVGALATYVVVAEVVIERLWIRSHFRAGLPLTSVAASGWGDRMNVEVVWMGRTIRRL